MITHQQARALLAAESSPGYEPLLQGLQALAWALSSYGFRFKGYPDVTDWNWYAITYPGACQGPGSDVRDANGSPLVCIVRYDDPKQGINIGIATMFPPNPDGSPSAAQLAFSTALATGYTDEVARLVAARTWGFSNREISFAQMGAASVPELSRAIYQAAQDVSTALGEPLRMVLPGTSPGQQQLPPITGQCNPGETRNEYGACVKPADKKPAPPPSSVGKTLFGLAIAGLAVYGAFRASLKL